MKKGTLGFAEVVVARGRSPKCSVRGVGPIDMDSDFVFSFCFNLVVILTSSRTTAYYKKSSSVMNVMKITATQKQP